MGIESTQVVTPRATESIKSRLGVVSFLNTVPLIEGLAMTRNLQMRCTVPSLLIDHLLRDEVDMALCSSIDYQRSPEPLCIIPCGLLGCDGPTLTVRLYSSKPIHKLDRVFCDTDSHTSVALMKILLREVYEIDPRCIDYNAREHVAENRPMEWPVAMLLIGDKVVTDSPPAVRYPHQLDLGAAWVSHTGRPFVFAAWMAKQSTPHDVIRPAALALDRQRRANRLRIESLAFSAAREHSWPADLAHSYLSENLAYDWTDARRDGLQLFFDKAHEHGLIEESRPLEVAHL